MRKQAVLALSLVSLIGSVFGAVTSVDKVQYKSNSEFFNGETILVGFVSDFSTEKINVHLGADDLSEATGKNVRDDVQLEVVSQNSYLEYGTQDINLAFDKLYTFNAVTETKNTRQAAWDWGQENCFQTDPSDSEWEGVLTDKLTFTGIKYKAWCVQDNGYYGKVGSLENPATIYETEWELQAGDKNPQRVTLSNQNENSQVRLGDHAVITNIGGLSLGARKPSISNVYALHSNDLPQNWRLVYRERYRTWTSFVQNSYEQKMIQWAKGQITEEALEREANSRASNAFQPAYETDIYNGLEVEDTSWSSGLFKYDTSEELIFPRFNIYIDAGENGYVTVEKPVGEPEIVESSGAEFGEYSDGTISVDVKNVADYEGRFVASIKSCSDPFSAKGTSRPKNVASGQTQSFELGIAAASGLDQQSIDGSCTISVSNSVGDTVSTSVDVTVNSEKSCVEGNEILKYPDGVETIMVCTDGFNLEKQDGDAVCGDGEKADLVATENGLNDYECKATDGSEEICGNNQDDDGDGKVDKTVIPRTVSCSRWGRTAYSHRRLL